MFNSKKSIETKGILAALDKSQAVVHFALDGTIEWANQNFLDAMGYRLDEIKGKHHSIFVHEYEVSAPAYAAFWQSLRGGNFHNATYRRFGKDGREVWIQATYTPILDGSGKPFKIVKFATDITEQKLKNAEYEGQINAIGKSHAVIHFNLDGTIEWANQNFLDAMGYRLDEITGRHHRMFVTPQEAASADYADFWRKLHDGNYHAGEFCRLGKGGREVWIQASYNPILNASGKPFKIAKFATDITAQVKRRNDSARVSTAFTNGLNQIASSVSNARSSAASVREINLRLADIIANMHNTPQSMQDALTAIDELARHVEALKGEIDTAASSAQEGISLYDQIRTL